MNDAGAFSSVRFYEKCVSKMRICVSTCLFVTLWSRCGLVMVYSRSRCGLVMVSVLVASRQGLRNNDHWTQPMEDGDAGRSAEVREGAGRVGREERCVI